MRHEDRRALGLQCHIAYQDENVSFFGHQTYTRYTRCTRFVLAIVDFAGQVCLQGTNEASR